MQDDLHQGTFLTYTIEGSCQRAIPTFHSKTDILCHTGTDLPPRLAVITVIPQLPFSAGHLRASTMLGLPILSFIFTITREM